eukprot:scaffold896_cov58-Attheya_sp.AAC.1
MRYVRNGLFRGHLWLELLRGNDDWVGLFVAAMTTGGPFPDNAASTSKAVGTSQLSNSTQSTIVCPAASGITTTVGNWSPMNSPRKPIVRPWRAVTPPMPAL